MRAHTRKHLTEDVDTSFHLEDDSAPVSADDYFASVYGNFPKPAVYLSGLRHREGLTQIELAKLLGVAQYNISKMERGKRPIGKDMAKRMAKLFKTDYRMFL